MKTGSGETVASVEGDAEIGGQISGGCAADHFLAADEGKGSSAGACGMGGADYEFVENQIEREIGWKTGEQVLLEEASQVKMRIVRAELGP